MARGEVHVQNVGLPAPLTIDAWTVSLTASAYDPIYAVTVIDESTKTVRLTRR